jgi:hypothetical protein
VTEQLDSILDADKLMAIARDERSAGNVLQAFGHASNAAERYRAAAIALAGLVAKREAEPADSMQLPGEAASVSAARPGYVPRCIREGRKK